MRTSGPRLPSGRSAASTGQATSPQMWIIRVASVAAARSAASPSAAPAPGSATNTTSTSLT